VTKKIKKRAFSLPIPEDEGRILVPVYQRRRHYTQASSIVYCHRHGSENLKPDSNLSKNLAMTQRFCTQNSCSNMMSVNLKPKA